MQRRESIDKRTFASACKYLQSVVQKLFPSGTKPDMLMQGHLRRRSLHVLAHFSINAKSGLGRPVSKSFAIAGERI